MNKIPPKVPSPIARPPSSSVIIQPMFPKPEFPGEAKESVIHPKFSGLVLTTGFRGKGKSSQGMAWDRPENILMLDYEDKEETGAEELGIKAYFPVVKEVIGRFDSNFDVVHIYNRTLQILEAVPPGRFTTLFIDNAQDLQEGCTQRIAYDPELVKKFGLNQKNVDTGGFGGAKAGAKRLIDNLLHLANSKGFKIISVSFQLKPAWINSQPAFNKWKMSDVTTWHEKSRLTMVLVDPMPEHFPVPRALIMKEAYSLRSWNEELRRVVQVRRFPMAFPKASPPEIYEYLDKPASFQNPKPGEAVTALEISPFTPTFGNENLFLFEKALRLQKELGIIGEEGE